MKTIVQALLDMGTVKKSVLEWTLQDICRDRAFASTSSLPKLPKTFDSLEQHASAYHQLLLAELHEGIKQARAACASAWTAKPPRMQLNALCSGLPCCQTPVAAHPATVLPSAAG